MSLDKNQGPGCDSSRSEVDVIENVDVTDEKTGEPSVSIHVWSQSQWFHSSQFQSLCSMKCYIEMLQNWPYFI